MIELFVGRPFLRRGRGVSARWIPVVLVLRANRVRLIEDNGTAFDVAASDVRVHLSRLATMTLTVDGDDYVFSNFPANTSPSISQRLQGVVDELYEEEATLFREAGLGKPPPAYLKRWRQLLQEAGSDVSGSKGNIERVVLRMATGTLVFLAVVIIGVIVWLVVNGGRPA